MPKNKKYTQARYWRIVESIIHESDVILEILDARFPYQTLNSVLEARIRTAKKPCIRVLTKADLISRSKLKKTSEALNAVPFSAKQHLNTRTLIREIMKTAKRHYKLGSKQGKSRHFLGNQGFFKATEKCQLRVGVVGYPNTGKSSVINALKGKKAAPTSPVAGFTRGKQWIRISQNLLLIDTPGIIPFKEKNQLNLILKSAITEVKDPESIALDLIEMLPKSKLEEFYDITISEDEDSEQTLKEIALKKHLIKKGNQPDLKRAGLMLIRDIQQNKLRLF